MPPTSSHTPTSPTEGEQRAHRGAPATRRAFLAALGLGGLACAGLGATPARADVLGAASDFFAQLFGIAPSESAQTSADTAADTTAGTGTSDAAGFTANEPGIITGYQLAYETIRSAAIACRTDEVRLDESGIDVTEDDYLAASDALRRDPRCLHWSNSTYTTVERAGVRRVVKFALTYRIDKAALATYQADLEWSAANIASAADPSLSPYDKVLFVYDWLINNVTYARDVAEGGIADSIARTPLGPIAYGTGVCSGYAAAFQIILEYLGVTCEYVNSEEMNHAWSVVCLDGSWYYADPTWDDPDDGGAADHFYFLVGEQTLARDHYGWTPAHEAPADLDRPGIVRLDASVYSLEDVVREAVLSYSGATYDVLDYRVDSAGFDACVQGLCDRGDFWGMSLGWHWNSSDDGIVRTFYITYG